MQTMKIHVRLRETRIVKSFKLGFQGVGALYRSATYVQRVLRCSVHMKRQKKIAMRARARYR